MAQVLIHRDGSGSSPQGPGKAEGPPAAFEEVPGQSLWTDWHGSRIHYCRLGEGPPLVLVHMADVGASCIEWRRNIEWLFLPSANENGFLDGKNDRDGKERLSVEIALFPSYGDKFSYGDENSPLGRNLELLDYIYFGVYTITTTGYGDIIPVTSFAKFITTVANFFEVFLMVIFFNVLISFFNSGSGSGQEET